MGKIQNKYPGFIDGLKASNISTNKVSLDVYSKQIEIVFSHLNKDARLSDLVKKTLDIGEEALDATETETNPENLINLYIKFGNVLKTITPFLKTSFPEELKQVAVSYLNIANYIKDTRVDGLAIDIAQEAEE